MRDTLESMHGKSFSNRELLLGSKMCGCFYCLGYFESKLVVDWVVDDTGICPFCGVDALVPEDGVVLTEELLYTLKEKYFF